MASPGTFSLLSQALVAAWARLDKSFSPTLTIKKLRAHHFRPADLIYIVHFLLATFWFTIMQDPPFPLKLLIPAVWILALLIPATSQFFLPATPIFSYLLAFYSSRFVPASIRPAISVSILPTLESVLYGANISDILTRFTHPVLDVIAWIPYGVGHFTLPFVVAIFVWLFRSKRALMLWGSVFGWMNLTGVLIQIVFPCSPPWYEVIHGLMPANYSMKGSPGGLARIDALLHTQMYTTAFTNSPMVFGAFPSLHAGAATMEALFISHFFPQLTKFVWAYTAVLYWATMYLTHHYLIDVVGGACMATAFFYLFLPDDLKGKAALEGPANFNFVKPSKYQVYDLEEPRGPVAQDFEPAESEDEEVDITYRSPVPAVAKFQKQQEKGHRHTASIASLIRSDERGPEEGWSPVTSSFGNSSRV
ncbi:inositolphosphorylceramide synthase [Coprinopsis cinerea okayama7|uniref:Inositolphosphorylceramide synthase n=1 Tax=Coprinopsis cinerea (strain Okayama-7 / 130 / ATCC MYA-4618 / FGSC 9003) TaxID=240176 RepID=A8P247_COPC7|nr:inositolphosphorylceramide synthase [Coprinopsis cinerea okayama7\|eukprot:XP_001838243.1 inositolphosphorylceramide synthase [Coprinopsis cinerea okayama7\